MLDWHTKTTPKRRDDRIILQFDYDCFYAQVVERANPALKSQPLGIRQKGILATCNYVARARGAGKLMSIAEAKRLCPEIVLVDGEDLTPFRDASKMLWAFFRGHSWNQRVERLGLDEVFMDVTDIIDFNLFCLNRSALAESFFCLSKENPELGYSCDLTTLAGCVAGREAEDLDFDNAGHLRLLLGSHLAAYFRTRLEEDYGYTCTCGISTNKVLSKLVGGMNKPRNQTTLLTSSEDDINRVMDRYTLRAVPGLGFKIAQTLQNFLTQSADETDSHSFESKVTVGDLRLHPSASGAALEKLLGGPGAAKGLGTKVWALLHGIDASEVKLARDVPSVISIEDTYKGLDTMSQITEQLHKLSLSLLRRMKTDLLAPQAPEATDAPRWMARPKTIRLSIRSWTDMKSSNSFNRASRSGPLPNFVFELQLDASEVVERLVTETLIPLLRRLQPERGRTWNLQLINICVANMATGAADDKPGVGRDIAVMFKHQDDALRPWKVTSEATPDTTIDEDDMSVENQGDDDPWDAPDGSKCQICGHITPDFALSAHLRFHDMGSEEILSR